MEYRQLGRSDLEMSVIGLGCWLFGNTGWAVLDDDESVRVIHRALDLGINWLDTSEIYGFGHSEEVIGKALSGLRRKDVIIATKVDPMDLHLSAKELPKALDRSLRNLKTDYVDLYQIHWPNNKKHYHSPPDEIPREETVGVLLVEKEKGKIRHIGVCNFDTAEMAEFLSLARFESLQPPYNLYWRHVEQDDIAFCREHNIGVLAYSPMAQGILAGRFSLDDRPGEGDSRAQNKLFTSSTYETAIEGLEVVRAIGKKYGKTLAQTAVRWVLQQPGVNAAICGARTTGHVEQSAGAAGWELSVEDLDALTAVGDRVMATVSDSNPTQWYSH